MMKVNAADQFASELVYNDGKKLMFESQGDMLEFYFWPDGFDVPAVQKNNANITSIRVKDQNTRQQLEGREAVLVYKSQVQSPMGHDVFAFARREDAEKFAAANGGRVLTFNELTPELVRNLRSE
jgi:copper chaperone NosL